MKTRDRLYCLSIAALLAVAVLVVHGWSLADGTVLDDHWHQKGLREHGWSLPELLRTLTIEPSQWMHHWWQDKPVRWEYARPAFILAMKLVYHGLGGDDARYLHAYSLLLHWICALLIWRLALRLTGARFWSVVGALLFVVYPHAVMTVQWSSSQNCVQQTALCLAALLGYLRASKPLDESPAQPLDIRWYLGALALWLVGLLTKENALVLPVIFVAFDAAYGGWPLMRRRMLAYAPFAVLGLAFILWRASVLTIGMPDVYMRRPAGDWPEYLAWCAAKLLHYICTSIWPAPMTIGPTGRFNPWVEAPWDCALTLGIVAALTFAYLRATRGVRGRWIWPLWILLAVLPVTPVIATAHSGYFAGVGFVIAFVLATSGKSSSPEIARPTLARHASRIAAFAYFAVFAFLTMFNRWQWTGIIAAERYVPAWVRLSPPAPETTDVFFLNLPFVNIYAQPAIAAGRPLLPGFESARVHVLTYAPQPVLLEQRSYVEQIDDHRFSIEIVGQRYFSRLLGRFLIDGFRHGGAFETGETIHADGFDARIVQADADGVRKLEFTFPRRLDDPRYCFYLTSIDCGAARLRFGKAHRVPHPSETAARDDTPAVKGGRAPDARDIADAIARLESGDARAAGVLFDALDDPRAADALRRIGGYVAQATGSRMQDLLIGPPAPVDELAPPPRLKGPQLPGPPPADGVRDPRVRAWWRSTVDDRTLAETWLHRHDFEAYVEAREEVPHARQWAALLARTDLYLTGPPFPGPRSR